MNGTIATLVGCGLFMAGFLTTLGALLWRSR